MAEARLTEAVLRSDVRNPMRALELNAERLSALGHPVRLRILRRVVKAGDGGLSAGDIQGDVGLPASTLSHHLKRLVEAGLLVPRCEGTFHFYSPDFGALRALTDYVWEDCCARGSDGKCSSLPRKGSEVR
ncbi:MAG: ArsR/SmtB family transcription factor [Myxococcota bacterium]